MAHAEVIDTRDSTRHLEVGNMLRRDGQWVPVPQQHRIVGYVRRQRAPVPCLSVSAWQVDGQGRTHAYYMEDVLLLEDKHMCYDVTFSSGRMTYEAFVVLMHALSSKGDGGEASTVAVAGSIDSVGWERLEFINDRLDAILHGAKVSDPPAVPSGLTCMTTIRSEWEGSSLMEGMGYSDDAQDDDGGSEGGPEPDDAGLPQK